MIPLYKFTLLLCCFALPHSSSNDTSREHRLGDGFVRVHSAAVLVTMPTPDFTMPFTVLCLVCSMVAAIYGSVHRACTGRGVAVRAEDVGVAGRFKTLTRRLRARVADWRAAASASRPKQD